MSARDIVGGLAGAAIGAVKHPVGTAGEAISKARTAVGAGTAVGTAVAGTVARRVLGDAAEAKDDASSAAKVKTAETVDKASDTIDRASEAADEAAGKAGGAAKEATVTTAAAAKTTADVAADAAKKTASKAAQGAKKAAKKTPATKGAESKAPAKKAATKTTKKAPQREPEVVLPEPAPPLEPPIDVVGQALAAEAQEDTGFGRTTEPRGASRDEEHGDAALQRAESEEIAEEMAEVARAGNLDLSTPVGTTGADAGYNPDTAEADLQQPGTEPLLDPSLTKEVKSEQDTLHQAADPEKG